MSEHDWYQFSGPAVCRRCGVVSSTRSSKTPCVSLAEHAEMRKTQAVAPSSRISIKPIFAWYDLWIGFFWDGAKRRLYVLPLPCIGVVIQFGPHP